MPYMGKRGGKRKSWAIVSNVTQKIHDSSYFSYIYGIRGLTCGSAGMNIQDRKKGAKK